MSDREKEQPEESNSATNEPWKHPGQSSQQPGQNPRNPRPKTERTYEDNKTA